MPGHVITVEHLMKLLNQLNPTDELIPTSVGTIIIARDGDHIGYISTIEGHQQIELYQEDEP